MTPTPPTITERAIQLTIHRERLASSEITCPNYTPIGWWECDLWQVTKSGYATEYEIKLSLTDFKADAKKSQRRYDRSDGKWQSYTEQKHRLLAERCKRGPSRFYYCVPHTLVGEVKPILPEWAGLVEFRPVEDWHLSRMFVVKDAPRLHRCKVNPKEIKLCKDRIVYRYWTALSDFHKAVSA